MSPLFMDDVQGMFGILAAVGIAFALGGLEETG